MLPMATNRLSGAMERTLYEAYAESLATTVHDDDVVSYAARQLKHHTHTHPFNGPLSGTTRVSRYQKGKTNLDFTEARDSWDIRKSAPRSRQITMPAPHSPVFTGRMPFLPPNQQAFC